MLRAGLVGVTGYTGMEISRILASHPSMRLTAATSRQDAGKRLDAVYPFLQGLPGADVTLIEPDARALAEVCDVVFLAVPHGVAMEMGADAVMVNTAIATAADPARMAHAFKLAVEAGRAAYVAGGRWRGSWEFLAASPTSPLTAFLEE